MTTTDTRQHLHRLIKDLPESELHAAERFLEYLHRSADPVGWALAHAPEDDEPETPEEAIAIAEAYEAIERGEVLTDDEFRRELGL